LDSLSDARSMPSCSLAAPQLISAVLRLVNAHTSRFVVLVLRRLLRAVWPEVAVRLRADSSFAAPRLYRLGAPPAATPAAR
jgi:hypothetical protein